MADTQNRFTCASIDIGVVNLAFCVTEFVARQDGTFGFNLLHIERVRIGSMKDSIQVLSKRLVAFYNGSEALNTGALDFVFIEQQLCRAVKNTALSFVSMAYFETRSILGKVESRTSVQFVSPKNKFRAVRCAFPEEVLSPINFEGRGRDLKKLSVLVAAKLFEAYSVRAGTEAMAKYGSKLDDVSDVFLQSFAFFLSSFFPRELGRGTTGGACFIRVNENREGEHANEEA